MRERKNYAFSAKFLTKMGIKSCEHTIARLKTLLHVKLDTILRQTQLCNLRHYEALFLQSALKIFDV